MARQRHHLCIRCHRIAHICVLGTEPAASYFQVETPATRFGDCDETFVCDNCIYFGQVSLKQYHNRLPADLSRTVYVSNKCGRWLTVECEELLRKCANCDALATTLQQRFDSRQVVTAQVLSAIIREGGRRFH